MIFHQTALFFVALSISSMGKHADVSTLSSCVVRGLPPVYFPGKVYSIISISKQSQTPQCDQRNHISFLLSSPEDLFPIYLPTYKSRTFWSCENARMPLSSSQPHWRPSEPNHHPDQYAMSSPCLNQGSATPTALLNGLLMSRSHVLFCNHWNKVSKGTGLSIQAGQVAGWCSG